MTGAALLSAALDFAGMGWRVLPCVPSGSKAKAPLLVHGLMDATTDPDLIRRWWARWPSALIGAVVPTNRVVLDVDPRHGGSVQSLEHHGGLPATLTCVSGRGDGGVHFYYAAAGGPFTSTRLPVGIDLRVAGKSYCIVSPSLHPDTGLPYRWEHRPVVAAPEWLLGLLRPAAPVPRRYMSPGPVTDVRLSGWLTVVVNATEGSRNARLFWAACRAVEVGVLADVRGHLVAAAEAVGLGGPEIDRTITSAARSVVGGACR